MFLFVLGAAPVIDQFIHLDMDMRTDPDVMLIAVLFLFKTALMLSGAAIANSMIPLIFGHDERTVALRRAFAPLIVILYVGLSVWLLNEFSSTIGRVDASITLANAPVARIEIASDHAGSFPGRSGEQDSRLKSGYFGVVAVGERFVYLLPAPNCELAEDGLYALPVEDVKEIVYMPDQGGCENQETSRRIRA